MPNERPPDTDAPSKHARDEMPLVTAWIDSLRDAFGKEAIDQAIRQGMKEGTFWAIENGKVIGRPPEIARRQVEAGQDAPGR